jgi:hypothetical protein
MHKGQARNRIEDQQVTTPAEIGCTAGCTSPKPGVEELAEAALRLPPEERVRLVGLIMRGETT